MDFEKFVSEVNRIAGYLKTRVSRVFNNEGNYVALLDECDAFDRIRITGRASSKALAFNRGDGHITMIEVH